MTDASELIKALHERAEELGWNIETNWRDGDDEQVSYDLYAWKQASGERSHQAPGLYPTVGEP